MSGFKVSVSHLGEPDDGILTLSEIEEARRNVITATRACKDTNIPDCRGTFDGDTGYGGTANSRRIVLRLAKIGAAAITIRSNVSKKMYLCCRRKCKGHLQEEACDRIKTDLVARDEAT